MRFAFADPPYIGQARRHYGTAAREVNHRLLIAHLSADYPDGWALSCSSPSLAAILPLCPPAARVGAWVKPFASWKPSHRIQYAWEPVIFCGGRHPRGARGIPSVRDFVSANMTMQRGTHGAKPEEFCFWLFDVLGYQLEDSLDDLFPGSGAVTDALTRYEAMLRQSGGSLWRESGKRPKAGQQKLNLEDG
jgi:hypothetical protein